MSVKARDIFQHAQDSFSMNSCDEITARMLINRAYYGIYGYVLSEVENRLFYNLDKNNPSVHQALINVFQNQKCSTVDAQKTLGKIATQLRQARTLRQNADYNLHHNMTAHDVKHTIALGNQIFDMLEQIN